MSEQNQNEQEAVTPAELSETSLENVAGGTGDMSGGCIPDFPGGCVLFPKDLTTF
jgi:hypothetical protein